MTPQPVATDNILSAAQDRFAGPAIEVALSNGDTSGRYVVAEIIGRVFPAYRAYASGVLEMIDRPLPTGPYPADILSYKDKALVEYKTPAESEGLGTQSRLQRSNSPIEGLALLFGQPPALLQLSVRLPHDAEGLTPVIIAQLERDALKLIHN